MPEQQYKYSHGPFSADQIKDGDRYELSNGNPIYCLPAGSEQASHNLSGGALLDSDPDVDWAGVDAGFSPDSGTVYAPDVAVASPPEGKGWISGVPPLAVEYAAHGQDAADLKKKIRELLAAGTRYMWHPKLKPTHLNVTTRLPTL